MLKKLALAILAVCCCTMAAQEKLYSINFDDASVFRVVGTYDDKVDGVPQAKGGRDVHVQIFAENGYVVEKAYALYDGDDSTELVLEDSLNSTYHFTMPKVDVVLKAEFKKKISAITVKGCDGEKIMCDTIPDSATFDDTVKIFYRQAFSGALSVMVTGDCRYQRLGNENGLSFVSFIMGASDVDVEFKIMHENEDAPTKFKLSIDGNFAKYCSYRNLSSANLDSANIGDVIDFVMDLPSDYKSFEMAADGLGEGDFQQVEKGRHYQFVMPENDVKFTVSGALFGSSDKNDETEYKITLKGCDGKNLVCESSKTEARYGEEFTVTVVPARGVAYEFEADSDLDCKEGEAEHSYTFTMVPRDTEIKFAMTEKKENVSDKKLGSSEKLYRVSVTASDEGEIKRATSVENHPDEMVAGSIVVLYVTPNAGYAFESLSIRTAADETVEWAKDGNEYKFTMPESDVEISATYKVATYKIDVACGEYKCENSESAHYGDDVTIKVNMNGQKKVSIRHTEIPGLEKKQKGDDVVITFTMPDNDVEFALFGNDEESRDSKGDDDKSEKKGTVIATSGAQVPTFNAQIRNQEIYVSGAHAGSIYTLCDMNGRIVAKGRVEKPGFGVFAPNAGAFFLRIGRQVRVLNVK